MKWGRTISASLALLLPLALPNTATAKRPGTSFKAKTEGSPVATELGTWSESSDGRSVNLELRGGHVVGTGTTFVATWLTPWTPMDESPSFESRFDFNNMNLVGDAIALTQSFRYRERGDRWSRWVGIKQKLPEQSWSSGGSISFFMSSGVGNYQFEWRLEGVIKAPTYLDGFAELHIN